MKYKQVVEILVRHGFECVRERATHKQYRGVVAAQTRLVTVDYAKPSEDVSPRNPASMIRQSGLAKSDFK